MLGLVLVGVVFVVASFSLCALWGFVFLWGVLSVLFSAFGPLLCFVTC